jgi:hypothetical protein
MEGRPSLESLIFSIAMYGTQFGPVNIYLSRIQCHPIGLKAKIIYKKSVSFIG